MCKVVGFTWARKMKKRCRGTNEGMLTIILIALKLSGRYDSDVPAYCKFIYLLSKRGINYKNKSQLNKKYLKYIEKYK